MKIKRLILKPEVLKEIKESMERVGETFDVKGKIKRKREKAKEIHVLFHDVLGIESKEYFFEQEGGKHVYCIHVINNCEFDSAGMALREDTEQSLYTIIVNGLANFLLGGINTILGLHLEENITPRDFMMEEVNLSEDKLSISTNTPARYVIIDKEQCSNVGFLFMGEISTHLRRVESELYHSGNYGLKIVDAKEFFKEGEI